MANHVQGLEGQRTALLSQLANWTERWRALRQTQAQMIASGRMLDVNFREPIAARMRMGEVLVDLNVVNRMLGKAPETLPE